MLSEKEKLWYKMYGIDLKSVVMICTLDPFCFIFLPFKGNEFDPSFQNECSNRFYYAHLLYSFGDKRIQELTTPFQHFTTVTTFINTVDKLLNSPNLINEYCRRFATDCHIFCAQEYDIIYPLIEPDFDLNRIRTLLLNR